MPCRRAPWSGRVRGRPGRPSLTRMPPTTVVNNDVSAALPAVSTRLSGLPLPSVARWILQVIPPLDRPIAWSGGSDSPSFLSFHPAPCVALECRAVLVDPGDRGVHRDDPVDRSGRGRRGLDRGQDPRPGPVGRQGREALIDRVPVTEPLRHIPATARRFETATRFPPPSNACPSSAAHGPSAWETTAPEPPTSHQQ